MKSLVKSRSGGSDKQCYMQNSYLWGRASGGGAVVGTLSGAELVNG